MDIPIGDGSSFTPADLNICIFPHLSEFLVIDSRSDIPGGPTTYLLNTDQVLNSEFYRAVETSVNEVIRETERTFSELGALPQKLDDVIRENTIRAIFGSLDQHNNDDPPPDIAIFLCAGAALHMDAKQIDFAMQSMLGDGIELSKLTEASGTMQFLVSQERSLARVEEKEMTVLAISGDEKNYYTLWSRFDAEESEVRSETPFQDSSQDETSA